MRTTLRKAVEFEGVGVHSGERARMRVCPASGEYGIWIKRVDLAWKGRDQMIPARWDAVSDTTLCTRLENADGVSISTVEHLMAALAGCGIWNALVEVDGPEIPIMDGSSAAFVDAFRAAGVTRCEGEDRVIRILRPVEVQVGDARASLEPADRFCIDFEIDFADEAIGRQAKFLVMSNGAFCEELSDCRTFGRLAEAKYLQSRGLARGASLDNAVVVDGAKVLNPGGLRHRDEFVRHKMLDAVGDLALAGAPIVGTYMGEKAGHGVTNALLHALFRAPDAFTWEHPRRLADLMGSSVAGPLRQTGSRLAASA